MNFDSKEWRPNMKKLDKIIAISTVCATTLIAVACDSLLFSNTSNQNTDNINREYAVSDFSEYINKYNNIIENDKSYIINIDSDLLASPNQNTTEDKKDTLDKDTEDNKNNKNEASNDSNVVEDKEENKEIDYNVMNNVDAYFNEEEFKNKGIANVDSYLNVRKGAGTNTAIVGKMPPNSECTILSSDGEWAKIKSGDVTGYVKLEYILTGDKAMEVIKEKGRLVIVVDCTTLRVRAKESTDSEILYKISKGEELNIVSSTKDWVKVEVNNGQGYVAREYVNISFALPKATAVETISGYSSVRTSLVEYSKKFLGNRYVYGGNSLTKGIDCSGFTQQIYAKFGYKLPRTSRMQANVGTPIPASQAKPGDLVFYSQGRVIDHVAICIGGGKIIHASNPRDGIKISNMYYTTPRKVVRIIND